MKFFWIILFLSCSQENQDAAAELKQSSQSSQSQPKVQNGGQKIASPQSPPPSLDTSPSSRKTLDSQPLNGSNSSDVEIRETAFHLAYVTSGAIVYMNNVSSKWTEEVLPLARELTPLGEASLATDSLDQPMISFKGQLSNGRARIFLARKLSGAWRIEEVYTDETHAGKSAVAATSFDIPVIYHSDSDSYGADYSTISSGEWSTYDVFDHDWTLPCLDFSLAIDVDDGPQGLCTVQMDLMMQKPLHAVRYWGPHGGGEKLFTYDDCFTFQGNIATDSEAHAHIVYNCYSQSSTAFTVEYVGSQNGFQRVNLARGAGDYNGRPDIIVDDEDYVHFAIPTPNSIQYGLIADGVLSVEETNFSTTKASDVQISVPRDRNEVHLFFIESGAVQHALGITGVVSENSNRQWQFAPIATVKSDAVLATGIAAHGHKGKSNR